MKRPLIIELRCKCGKHFLYCHRRGSDFRCDSCRMGMTPEEVEKELSEMDIEEYASFMEDIAEYEKEHGKVDSDE